MINLKEKRAELGLSLAKMSEKIGVSRQYIYQVEEGIRNIPVNRIEDWAKAYELDPKQVAQIYMSNKLGKEFIID